MSTAGMPLVLLGLLLQSFGGILAAQPVQWFIDTEASTLSYTGHHPLHNWTGTSGSVTGRVRLDLDRPSEAEIEMGVPLESFDSGNSNRDSNMLEVVEVWLFPDVTFQSEHVSIESWEATQVGYTGIWQVQGLLSFHGKEQSITVPVAVEIVDRRISVTATFLLDLDRFNIDRPKLMLRRISNEIELNANLVFLAEG